MVAGVGNERSREHKDPRGVRFARIGVRRQEAGGDRRIQEIGKVQKVYSFAI
ncbi:hypothetical protein V0288_14410 [Pannus brasiliensis CCIBt3594]|uniref:Uncharacterized protein n=1 Tax=Pannus brasiliensis CCIBt3594 TaxID=1427578 RepID=A0AAW9QTE9_9CHRO